MAFAMPRHWWFFGALLSLSLAAISIPWVFNNSIQLTAVQLQKAQDLWQKNALQNYDLEILISTEPGGIKNQLLAKVRQKKTISLIQNGKFSQDDILPTFQVENLLATMAINLDADQKAGQPFFTTASLSSKDGHPLRYVRRNAKTKERTEWVIKMKIIPDTF